jgi:Tfp pilus assembly protein PilO
MNNDKATKNKYLLNVPSSLTSERSQKFFGIILTFCALSFFGFFAIKPTVSTIFKLQKEIKDNEFVLGQLETKIINLTQLKTAYSDLQGDIPVAMNAITVRPDVALLLAQIQSVGTMSNVTIKKLQNFEVQIVKNENSAEKDHYSFSFSIGGNGSSDNIYKFMQTISNMERVINVDSFSINSLTTGEKDESLDFTIQGSAFFKSSI